MKTPILAGLMLYMSACATAQDGEAPAAVPCSDPGYSQFDFWLGDWVVTDTQGNVAGTNSITAEEGGCLLVERWTATSGNTGQSYNYYNPQSDTWRQVWVSRGAIIDYSGGLTDSGSMRLEGEITYQVGEISAPFMGEWTLNEDGTVTQHFEQFDAETDSWNPWFTGIYTKAEAVDE